MKKCNLLILFIVIFATTNAQLTEEKKVEISSKTIEWQTFTTNHFIIQHPITWDVDTSGQFGTNLFLFSQLKDDKDQFRENVNLIIQDLIGNNLNLDQYVEISENQIKTMITDGKIILSERKKVNDLEFQKVIYTGKQGIFDLKFEQYYWIMSNTAYVVTLTCEIDQFEAYRTTGEKILNSFKFKKN